MPSDSPDILIVRFSSIGDLVLTTPLLRAIRRRYPLARITFVVREDMADTVRHNPHLTEVVAWRRGSSLLRLAGILRRRAWTHRLDLHGSLRSHLLRALVGGRWTTYPKDRRERQLLIQSGGKRGTPLRHVAERYFDAARELGVQPDGGPAEFFPTAAAVAAADAFLAKHALGMRRQLVALAPGAAHFTKRWPDVHWIALARELASTYDLIVVGGPGDRNLGEAIAAAAGSGAANAAGHFTLDGSGALLRRAIRLVAGDTGLLHLATAVGTPVVGLYGPTVEAFGFFPYRAPFQALQHDLPCRPCSSQGGRACPLGHHDCLVKLLPGEVRGVLP